MFKALLHITLPEDDGEDRHFAPIILALEAMCAVNEWHIKRSLKRAAQGKGSPVPPLYASGIRYKEDDAGHEDWRDCYTVLKRGFGDCVPVSTLVLRDDYELVPIVSLRPGDRIMGDGAWTTATEVMVTGEKSILAIDLSNGCTLRCSPDHRVFRDVNGQVEEVRASEIRVGDDLVTPRELPISSSSYATDSPIAKIDDALERAWLIGTYVADGWCEAQRFAISGRDGKPKEEQKRRVEAILKAAGVHTRWHERYLAANSSELAHYFATCGGHAPVKRVPSLRLTSTDEVRAMIEGLAADAGHAGNSNTRVFGTTSPQLALQLRVLHRMLGISTRITKVDDHGGLGTHPIYRVIPREKIRDGYSERRDLRFARVRAVADGGTELCADITTDSGRFWLPESDVLVHNCDNLVAYRVGELRAAGIQADPVVKWQLVPKDIAVKQLGYPSSLIPDDGFHMVHCAVRFPDGRIEDPSKLLGMGGRYTNRM